MLVWRAGVHRRRRPRRAHRDVADAGHRPRRGPLGPGRAGLHRADRRLLPRLRAEGVRPVSSNGVLGDPTRSERRGGAAPCSTRWSATWPRRSHGAGRCVSSHRRTHEPGAPSSRGRRAASAPRRWTRWWRTDGASSRSTSAPTIRRSTTRWPPRRDLEEVAARHGDAVRAVVGDVRFPADMRAAVDEAVATSAGSHAAVAAAGRDQRGPAAVGDVRRPVGRPLRRERERRAPPGRGGGARPAGAAAAAPRALRRRGVCCRAARACAASPPTARRSTP